MGVKGFTWSYSKLKNFEKCPRQHYEIDLCKKYQEPIEPGGPLDWGNRVHASFAKALTGKEVLPLEMSGYQREIDLVRNGAKAIKVEQKFAITHDFQPTGYFASNVWYRGVADVVSVDGPVALAVDWKTGKILEDYSQLFLMAQCVMSHNPGVQAVRTEYVWLKDWVEDKKRHARTTNVYRRDKMAVEWTGLLPRVEYMEHAHKAQSYPPKRNTGCKWCPVETCPYQGKGMNQ